MSVQNAFKHNKARKHVIIGGALIMFAITVISCVSSFMIYREGFLDLPYAFQQVLSAFAVVVVEGAFVWLVYGFTRAFSSGLERLISLVGMAAMVAVMTINMVTHFMMVKNIPLNNFQMGWLNWGAIMIFVGVLLIVLMITLADPVIRLIRLELRYLGKQQETILEAKIDGLEGPEVITAMQRRAEAEAKALANRVLTDGAPSPAGAHASTPQTRAAGFVINSPQAPANFVLTPSAEAADPKANGRS